MRSERSAAWDFSEATPATMLFQGQQTTILAENERASVVMFTRDGAATVMVPRDQDERKLAFAQIVTCDIKFPALVRYIVYADAQKVAVRGANNLLGEMTQQQLCPSITAAVFMDPTASTVEGMREKQVKKMPGMEGPCHLHYWVGGAPQMEVAQEQVVPFLTACQISNHEVRRVFFVAVMHESGNTFTMTPEQAECHLLAWSAGLFVKQPTCHWCSRGEAQEMRVCGNCKFRTYCSKECQKHDWSDSHKILCPMYQQCSSVRKEAKKLLKSLQ